MTMDETDPNADNDWVKARSSIVWIAALLVAFGAVWWIERATQVELIAKAKPAAPVEPAVQFAIDLPPEPAPRSLTPLEKQWAQAAWDAVDRGTDAQTGLAPAAQGLPSVTMWDAGSALMALLAARQLELIPRSAFDERLARALAALARLPLYADAVPNLAYDLRTLRMTDSRHQPQDAGTGWSAIDVGRLVVPLHAVLLRHPKHAEQARAVLARWNTAQLATRPPLQEERKGFERYAARAFGLLGVEVDSLRATLTQEIAPQAWWLGGIEFGQARAAREQAWRAYQAQVAARTAGTAVPAAAAFGWHALFRTPAAAQWVEAAGTPAPQPDLHSNAAVLESLAYVARGRLLDSK